MLTHATVYQQLITTISALILFCSFMLLVQKRTLGIINTFAAQSFLLCFATLLQGLVLNESQMYVSALLTFVLKVLAMPFFLRYLVLKLNIPRNIEILTRPAYVLVGALVLVIYCSHIIAPINLFSSITDKNIVVVAMSVMLLGMLLMIARSNAITHVLGFMSMENGLFFAALMATHGMPMVVELGVAFDLLVAVFLFAVLVFQIRSTIESMSVDSLNLLREDLE